MTEFADCHRQASVVLMDDDGRVHGRLPPVRLKTPWLQEIADLVDGVRQRDGLSIVVLRMLTLDDRHMPELVVEYLAQASIPAATRLEPWRGTVDAHPLRMPYAKPGGPQRELAWAEAELARIDRTVTARRQIRTWNLSSIWRLTAGNDTFWLKSVPPFFAHEGPVLQRLAEEAVPQLVAHDGCRVLLRHIPGDDCYDAGLEQMRRMVETLVDLQWRWRDCVDELLALGLPDQRLSRLTEIIEHVVEQQSQNLAADDRTVLDEFATDLPARLARLDECGIPSTLVHGDYHPGNWRGEGLNLTMLDWGDCFIGHPLLDLPALLGRAGDHADAVLRRWQQCWAARCPEADVATAVALTRPLASARAAALYQQFLDNIEPSERPFHDGDPAASLTQTAALLRGTAP